MNTDLLETEADLKVSRIEYEDTIDYAEQFIAMIESEYDLLKVQICLADDTEYDCAEEHAWVDIKKHKLQIIPEEGDELILEYAIAHGKQKYDEETNDTHFWVEEAFINERAEAELAKYVQKYHALKSQ